MLRSRYWPDSREVSGMTKHDNDNDKQVYMISVAAKLTGMHPQTLRIYERKKLVQPGRTAKSTRLYSERDIVRLKYIQQLTQAEGVNLAGVAKIMALQNRVEAFQRTVAEMEEQISTVNRQIEDEVEQATKKYRHELVLVPKARQLVRIVVRDGDRR